jgi:hypothetical protein
MSGETEAHGAVTEDSGTPAGSIGPPAASRSRRAWGQVAGKAAGAAVLLAVAADRLGLHFFLFVARVAVRAYALFGTSR